MIKDFAIVSSNVRVTFFFLCRLIVTKKTSIQISEIGKKIIAHGYRKKNVTCIKTKHAHILKCQIVL